ncbi:MAG: response regulator [Alkalispirochaeta sp.]
MATDVLIVEDESIVALDLENRLISMGFSVVGRAGTGAEALEIVERAPPHVVLMDIQLRGDIDGIDTADRIQEAYDVPVIFLTAFSDSDSLDRAKRSNAYGYLLKPFQERELSISIELALYKHGAERELRENRALFGITLNNVTEGIVTADRSDRILFMNRAAERLTGWSASEAIGADFASIVLLDAGTIDNSSLDGWMRLTPRGGKARTVAVTSNDLDRPSRNGGSRVVVIRDVTHEQEHRDNLVAAKEAAESAVHAKSDFLARVTHELRTPLNSIVGMTSLLKGESNLRAAREYLEILDLSSQQLMALISDILDYARFDSGRLSLQRELFDPVATVERVSRSFAVEAGRKGLRVITVVEPTTPRAIYGDEARFGQVLRNIISNAVKFTIVGHIAVTVQPTTGQMLSVLVEDTGPGVASDHRSLIFEDFSQIESPATRTTGGMGLGLALVRRLVEAMEGSVELRDSSSGGSTFVVEIPFAPAEESLHTAPASPVIHTAATDDALIARAWEPWCAVAGVTLTCVAWSEILAVPAAFDLIITTEEHRSEAPESASLLVVRSLGGRHGTQSSHAPPENLILEPVPSDMIRDTIFGAPPRSAETNVVEESPAAAERLTLLVVDDDKNSLVFLRKLLESHGHGVVTAVDGEDALQALRNERFDAAILDIEMPGMDGWELARRIRSGDGGESRSDLPLVALSGHATGEIAHRATEVGFDDVLSKPVPVETMIRILLTVAKKAESQTSRKPLISEIRDAIESGNDRRVQQLLMELRQQSLPTGVAESAFRLVLALRRRDDSAVKRLIDELEKETDR